jgi:hypothetical protein
MTSVFQIIHDGNNDIVVPNMEIGMDYISRVIAPHQEDQDRLRSTSEFPALDDERLCGSLNHRIMREAYEKRRSFVVVEHELRGVVNGSTVIDKYDLVIDFDPSYIVQDGLWAIAKGDRDIEEEAKMVQGFVALSVKVHRKSKADGEILEHYRRKHAVMKGPDLQTDVEGNATNVLDALPDVAREKFLELAYIAFPEQAPVKAKVPTISL